MANVIKQAKQKAKDEARKTAKQMGEEFAEIPKQAIAEATGQNTGNGEDPIVAAMKQGSREISDTAQELIHKEEKATLDYLQKELEALRKKKKLEEKAEIAEEIKQGQEAKEGWRPLEEVQTRQKRGLPTHGKAGKTKGSGEMVKSKK